MFQKTAILFCAWGGLCNEVLRRHGDPTRDGRTELTTLHRTPTNRNKYKLELLAQRLVKL
jgi:hypothetical protein